jgi:hypothetical protein
VKRIWVPVFAAHYFKLAQAQEGTIFFYPVSGFAAISRPNQPTEA